MLPTGQGGGASHQRGNAFPTLAGRLYGFPRAKPGCPVFASKGGIKKWRPKGRPPSQRSDTIYLPRAKALNQPVRRSRSQAEPWQPRAERPGGWFNPHARKGVSTYGNTGKHRPGPGSDRAEGRLNPQARQGAALKDGKRYLRLPYLPVLPDPSAFFPLLS